MPTDQIKVFNQTEGSNGSQTCGYHTLKNILITLMFHKNLITDQEYHKMLESKDLFEAIYKQLKTYQFDAQGRPKIDLKTKEPMVDLSAPVFIQKLDDIRNGKIIISSPEFPTFQDKLNKLKEAITANTENGDLTVVNCSTSEEFGLFEGQLPAAIAAKFARQPGPSRHIFACGIAEHWLTFVVNKDAEGVLTWQYMDSLEPSKNKSYEINIEKVLKKKPLEFKNYLLQAYGANSQPVEKYDLYFDNAGNPRCSSYPNLEAHFSDRNIPCNLLRLHVNPISIELAALKEHINKIRLDQQAKEAAIAPTPGAERPVLPELESCFLMYDSKIYYASFVAKTIVELESFEQNSDETQQLFTQDFTVATEDQQKLLCSVVIPNAKEQFVTSTYDCHLVLSETNPTAMNIDDLKKQLDTDAILLYENDLYYANRAEKTFTRIQLPPNSEHDFQKVKRLFTSKYAIASPDDQQELANLLPAWKKKIGTSIGLIRVFKNANIPKPPSEFKPKTDPEDNRNLNNLFGKLKPQSDYVVRYGDELYHINHTVTQIKKEGNEEQYGKIIGKFTSSSYVKADEETIRLIDELMGDSHKKNLRNGIVSIEQRFKFMKTAGWLQPQYKGDEEHERIFKLRNISHFILRNIGTEHPTDKEATCFLTPIVKALDAALELPIQHLPPIADSFDLNDPDLSEIRQQAAATLHSYKANANPGDGATILDYFVESIARILEAFRDAFWYVASHISVGA